MRGPIDYLIVGFEGNNFNGNILKELGSAVDNGTIAVLDIAAIVKDENGEVTKIEALDSNGSVMQSLMPSGSQGLIGDDDVEEMAEILENNCSAGLLIIEHLWAKGVKKAIIDANGFLIAEGRIHPEASEELNAKEGE